MKKFYFLTLALICAFVANAEDLYLRGGFNNWGTTDKFTEVKSGAEWTISKSGPEVDNVEFKVDNGSWTNALSNGGTVAVNGSAVTISTSNGGNMKTTGAADFATVTYTVKKSNNVYTLTVTGEGTAKVSKIASGTKLYFSPSSSWNNIGGKFAAYFFDGNGSDWADAIAVENETNIYEVVAPGSGAEWDKVIFVALKAGATAANWDNKQEQTADLIYDGENNLYLVESSTWSKFVASENDNPTAIETVGADAATAVYYNLQGMKVANPENGIFVKVQGNKAVKVIL